MKILNEIRIGVPKNNFNIYLGKKIVKKEVMKK